MNADFVIKALRAGATETQIAQSLNVSPSAVSQFIETNGISEKVRKDSPFQEIDAKLNSIEGTVVTQLEKSLRSPFNKIANDPMKIAQVLKIVNGAKRRSLAEGSTIIDQRTALVQLNLPARAIAQVRKNSQNEVIEVEGRALQTMQSGRLLSKLKGEDDGSSTKAVADLL